MKHVPFRESIRRRLGGLYAVLENRLEAILVDPRWGLPPTASRVISLTEVGYAASGRRDYAGSPWTVLRRILPEGEIAPSDVFVDIGCGMGRVVLAAAHRYPFKRVIGVDVVPAFTDAAGQAVERNRHRLRTREVELVTADVATWEVPDDVTVAYLFDPVYRETLDAVLGRLVASVDRRPRRLRVIYLTPNGGGPFDESSRVRLIRYGRRAVRRWAQAEYLRLYEIQPFGVQRLN